jgi:hypothetical protein
MKPEALKWILAFAFGLAMASLLAPSARAGPEFDLHLLVPGPVRIDVENSPAPLMQGIDGTNGLGGSGSAFGRAQLGNLGAKTTGMFTGPLSLGASSLAEVAFHDEFPVFIAGPLGSGDFLSFTVSLHGSSAATGGGSSQVSLDFSVSQFGFANGTVHLTGPGTATTEVPLEVGFTNFVDLDAFLDVGSGSSGPGSAVGDFSQSFKIDAVQLFDSHDAFIRDITLVDDKGNVLPIATAAVPEPESLLLAIGTGAPLVAVGLRRWWRRG